MQTTALLCSLIITSWVEKPADFGKRLDVLPRFDRVFKHPHCGVKDAVEKIGKLCRRLNMRCKSRANQGTASIRRKTVRSRAHFILKAFIGQGLKYSCVSPWKAVSSSLAGGEHHLRYAIWVYLPRLFQWSLPTPTLCKIETHAALHRSKRFAATHIQSPRPAPSAASTAGTTIHS